MKIKILQVFNGPAFLLLSLLQLFSKLIQKAKTKSTTTNHQKTKFVLILTISVTLLLSPVVNFGQPPNLGTAGGFVFFTVNGTIVNTGVSQITGKIGTDVGAITGFGYPSSVNGTIHIADTVTEQCSTDLLIAYNQLDSTSPTSIHGAVLGNGETLYAGVYSIIAAGSAAGTLTLDAQGDSNAVFIFKIGAAFTTGASTRIDLLNGASALNVFWIAEGAITLAAATIMKGTFLSHNGAVSMGAGCNLEGRIFSTTGNLTVEVVSASILYSPVENFEKAPSLGSLTNFILFTTSGAIGNTGVSQITGNIGTDAGAITGFGAPSNVNGNIYNGDGATAQCIIDLEAAYLQLSTTPATNTSHNPVFGDGETLFTGVYSIGAAASVAGTLTLDAQQDPNAVFIFKIGGAFTTGASATVILINGASACNVFWIAEGAISMAALTTMKGTLIAHPGAVSMGAGCNLEGRMFSTAGAVSVYGDSASIPKGCSISTSWTGAAETADWFNSGNWNRGVPDTTINALIPTTLLDGRVFPIIDTSIAGVDTVTIQDAARLTITNSILKIRGAIVNNGIVNARNGGIELAGLSGQELDSGTFENNSVNNLIISNSSENGVTLAGALDVYGSLTYSQSGMKLTTNDGLTLKSTALNTAWIGDLTEKTISGEVTVERHITNRKAWWFLSIPTNTMQTIQQSWQEGATSTASNPDSGYGTQITSDRPTWSGEGFDFYSPGGPSMKKYNDSTETWQGVTNTNSRGISTTGGYMLFVRGDRTANTYNSVSTETVLRTQGSLYTGDQAPIIVNAGKFASIGNPYASELDMRNINKTGVKDFFYVWDPNLGGSFGYGGYQIFSFNEYDYVVTPGMGSYGASGSISNYIKSGQAFLIEGASMGGNLTFMESAKAGDGDQNRQVIKLPHTQLRINLYGKKADSGTYMIDGVLCNYGHNYSNNIDDMDAIKPMNTSENLSIKKTNTLLAIERRHSIAVSDTIFLNLANTRVQSYRFELTGEKLKQHGLTGFLEDSYLNTSTALNLSGKTLVNFNIVNLPGSYAPDRFRIVFKLSAAPLITFNSIEAYDHGGQANVEWKVENEINNGQYETEKSIDGIIFTHLSFTKATGIGRNSVNYLSADMQPFKGYNYYRIKSVDPNNGIIYSNVVKLLIEDRDGITVYPNPVIDARISINFKNMPAGKYLLHLSNNLGQTVFRKFIQHEEVNSKEEINMNKSTPRGIFKLEITTPGRKKITRNVVY